MEVYFSSFPLSHLSFLFWRCLCESSSLKHSDDNSKSEIIQEYLFHNLLYALLVPYHLPFSFLTSLSSFCYENHFSFEQTSKIILIVENFLNTCFTDPSFSQEAAVTYFREQVSSSLSSLLLFLR
jgi:hypothetical protein